MDEWKIEGDEDDWITADWRERVIDWKKMEKGKGLLAELGAVRSQPADSIPHPCLFFIASI